jgi:ubiquinone/menaquinone biosynthesis C-methylase UbiE
MGDLYIDPELETTKIFWDSNPCGFSGDFRRKRSQRYQMEPYLPDLIKKISQNTGKLLEIGCGQGIDAIEFIANSNKDFIYTGIDYSGNSVKEARQNYESYRHSNPGRNHFFMEGNAENLNFQSDSFDVVYSMGVIHHTKSIENAIKEIKRVLKPGGKCYIFVYRTFSLKVFIAHALRFLQRLVDLCLFSNAIFYKMLRKMGPTNSRVGTMFLECFGVPYLNSYTKNKLIKLFREFTILDCTKVGLNFGKYSNPNISLNTPFGYLWLIVAEKNEAEI